MPDQDIGIAELEYEMTELKYEDFLQYLVHVCEMGRTVGSNIGVFWLESFCERQLAFQSAKKARTKDLPRLTEKSFS